MATETKSPQAAPLPAFIRFPGPGERDPVCGLSRSQLRKIVIEFGVRTISLKVPRPEKLAKKLKGDSPARGSRLIDVSDLIQKINERAEQDENLKTKNQTK